jgi:hypothetical protein
MNVQPSGIACRKILLSGIGSAVSVVVKVPIEDRRSIVSVILLRPKLSTLS